MAFAGQFAQFAQAAATPLQRHVHAGRGTGPLPRVRYWEAWNEPNAGREIAPQRVNGQPVSPAHYRRMVNAFAAAVHGVNAGNLVVAGTLGPFGHDSKDIQVVAPMRFMSDLLCVSLQAPHRRLLTADPLRHLGAQPVHERRPELATRYAP